MTLEEAWNIIDLLNDNSNKESKNVWLTGDINLAVKYQSFCFRKNFLELDKHQQELIQHWINTDDEFQDYFKCLFGTE